jgi:hypothetical protein
MRCLICSTDNPGPYSAQHDFLGARIEQRAAHYLVRCRDFAAVRFIRALFFLRQKRHIAKAKRLGSECGGS